MFLCPCQTHWAASGGPGSAFTVIVFLRPPRRIIADANVIGAVRTQQHVAVEHGRKIEVCPSASSGHHFLCRKWWRRGESEF